MSGSQRYIQKATQELRDRMEDFYKTATPLEIIFLLNTLILAEFADRDGESCPIADVAGYFIPPQGAAPEQSILNTPKTPKKRAKVA